MGNLLIVLAMILFVSAIACGADMVRLEKRFSPVWCVIITWTILLAGVVLLGAVLVKG